MTAGTGTRHPGAWVVSIVTLGSFWALNTFDWTLFRAFTDDPEGLARVGALALYRYLPQLLIPLLLAAVMFGARRAPSAMGLDRPVLPAVLFALAVTSVMPVTFMVVGAFAPPKELAYHVLRGAVLPGFFEEVFFRAFLFGFLFRFAGWGFLPATLIGALIFGAGHLYQSSDPQEAVAIFAITAFGAVWFSWLYAEWDGNVWVPAGTHILMNLWWMLFAVSGTAMGPMAANLARLGVIAASVVVTLVLRRNARVVKGWAWLWRGRVEPAAATA